MSKRKTEVQGSSNGESFVGDGSSAVAAMDQHRKATAAQIANRRIRQARPPRRPFSNTSTTTTSSAFSSLAPANPNSGPQTAQATQLPAFVPPTAHLSTPLFSASASAQQQQQPPPPPSGGGSSAASLFGGGQSFSFSVPSESFSFSAPATNNPFASTNGSFGASNPVANGFSGSIFNLPPSVPSANLTPSRPAQPSTVPSQLPHGDGSQTAPQPPATVGLFGATSQPQLFGASVSATAPSITPLTTSLPADNTCGGDQDITMLSASPDSSSQKSRIVQEGLQSPNSPTNMSAQPQDLTRKAVDNTPDNTANNAPNKTPEKAADSAANDMGNNTANNTTTDKPTAKRSSDNKNEAEAIDNRPYNIFREAAAQGEAAASTTMKPKDAVAATSSTLDTTNKEPVPAPLTSKATSMPTTAGPSSSANNNKKAAVFGSSVERARLDPKRPRPSGVPKTAEEDSKYKALIRLFIANKKFKKAVADLPLHGDFKTLCVDYLAQCDEYGSGMPPPSIGSGAGSKRKETDDTSQDDKAASRKRPKPDSAHRGQETPGRPTAQDHSKRKADEELTKDGDGDPATIKRAKATQDTASPKSPSHTSSLLSNILNRKSARQFDPRTDLRGSKSPAVGAGTSKGTDAKKSKTTAQDTVKSAPAPPQTPSSHEPAPDAPSALSASKPSATTGSSVAGQAASTGSSVLGQAASAGKAPASTTSLFAAKPTPASGSFFGSPAPGPATAPASGSSLFKPAAANNDSASTAAPSASGATTGQTMFKPSVPGGSATTAMTTIGSDSSLPQPPKFGTGPVNFMAQFGKVAQENAEAEKAKRKAEDFDSEDEDEAEWERRDAENQLSRKKKIEEEAKAAKAQYIPGKGFAFVSSGEKDGAKDGKASDTTIESVGEISKPTMPPPDRPKGVFGAASTDRPSSGVSIFDQPQTPVSRKIRPDNIFAHLSDSGADSGKTGDVDEDETDTGEEGKTSKTNIAEKGSNVSYPSLTQGQNGRIESDGDGDAGKIQEQKSEEAAEEVAKQGEIVEQKEEGKAARDATEQGNGEATKKNEGRSLFDRVSRAEDDDRPLPTALDDVAPDTPAAPAEADASRSVFGQKSSSSASGGASVNFNSSPSTDNRWNATTPIKFGATVPGFSFASLGDTKGGAPWASQSTKTGTFGSGGPLAGSVGATSSAQLGGAGFGFGVPSATFGAPETTDTGRDTTDERDSAKEDQLDLTQAATGEEDENVLFTVHGKGSAYDTGDNVWKTRGVGQMRVLMHRQSGSVRLVMRQERIGNVILNTPLLKAANYEIKGDARRYVSFPAAAEDGSVTPWLIQVKERDEAKALVKLLEKAKRPRRRKVKK